MLNAFHGIIPLLEYTNLLTFRGGGYFPTSLIQGGVRYHLWYYIIFFYDMVCYLTKNSYLLFIPAKNANHMNIFPHSFLLNIIKQGWQHPIVAKLFEIIRNMYELQKIEMGVEKILFPYFYICSQTDWQNIHRKYACIWDGRTDISNNWVASLLKTACGQIVKIIALLTLVLNINKSITKTSHPQLPSRLGQSAHAANREITL